MALIVVVAALMLASPAWATFPSVGTTATSSSSAPGTSHTVTLPSSIASGDLLIIFFGLGTGSDTSITWPGGYTQVDSRSTGAASTDVTLEVRYRIADGTEGASITVTTSNSRRMAAVAYRITGAHASAAPEGTSVNAGTGTTPDPPSLTPSWGAADDLWLAAIALKNGNVLITADPSSYTSRVQAASTDSTGVRTGTTTRTLNAASENPGTYTIDTSGNAQIAATVAVRPVVAGTRCRIIGGGTGLNGC